MNKIIRVGAAITLILLFCACRFVPEELETDKGSMLIDITANLGSVKTIVPPIGMEIAIYDIHGSGPNGALFNLLGMNGATVVQQSLAVGAWNIVVDGKNSSGTKIAMGVSAATIVAGQTVACNVLVTPLTGNGAMDLVVSWQAGILTNPAVSGTLTPVGGSSTNISFTLSGDGLLAFYQNNSCAAGYYTLTLRLLEGSMSVWGAVETVRIVAYNTTSGNFALTADDIKGDLSVQITPALDKPIQISLSGQQPELDWGKSMTITATPATGVDSYQWYLDGTILTGETNSSITIGRDLVKGKYRLDLVVTKSNVLSSTYHSFKVTQVSIEELISQIEESKIYNTTFELQNFITRRFGYAGNTDSGTYLFNRLDDIEGLQVKYQGGSYRNIIATLPSANVQSDAICIVGAHYDSISGTPSGAPGATDNGCGVGIVLEFARILSQYKFNNTVEFALWNDEEDGQQGSTNFVTSANQDSVNIIIYMNLDSAGYDPDNRFILDIMYNSNSGWIADLMTENNSIYGIGLTLTRNLHGCSSDYLPFWDFGYPAVMTHSEEHGPSHSQDDTVNKVSTLYAKKNGQLHLSVLAALATP